MTRSGEGILRSRRFARSVRASGCWEAGSDLTEVLRHLEITESTWHRWRRAYAGMSASDARRLKELEADNARSKKLLAEAELDKAMLKELVEGNGDPGSPSDRR